MTSDYFELSNTEITIASQIEVTEIELREAAEIEWFPGDWVICRTT